MADVVSETRDEEVAVDAADAQPLGRRERAERAGTAASSLSVSSLTFEQRLEQARRVKNEALSKGGDDDLGYFLKKQLQQCASLAPCPPRPFTRPPRACRVCLSTLDS